MIPMCRRENRQPMLQAGSVLILSVIMLMALTLLAISAIKMGTVNLRAVNNLQSRAEAMAAAEAALNFVLSTSLTNSDGTPVDPPDMNVAGLTVQIAPPCVRTTSSVANSDLPQVFTNYVAECQSGKPLPEQATFCRCLSASEYRANDRTASNCYRLVWDVTATVNNSWFGANVTVTHGVATQLSSSGYYKILTNTANYCS